MITKEIKIGLGGKENDACETGPARRITRTETETGNAAGAACIVKGFEFEYCG